MDEELPSRPEKLKIQPYEDGFEIIGNRRGLRGMAEILLALSDLPENAEGSRRLGNHYHYSEFMNNLEPGSIPLLVLYDPDL